jgi:hypothetical protein
MDSHQGSPHSPQVKMAFSLELEEASCGSTGLFSKGREENFKWQGSYLRPFELTTFSVKIE